MKKTGFYINTRDFNYKTVEIDGLEKIQTLVQGRFDRISIDEYHDLICNEEFCFIDSEDFKCGFCLPTGEMVLGPTIIVQVMECGGYRFPKKEFLDSFLRSIKYVKLVKNKPQ